MGDSPGGKSGKSLDAKSIASKASISVKLPSAQSEEFKRKSASPTRASPTRSRHGDLIATLEGQEFGRTRPLTTTPVSSKEFDHPSRVKSNSRLAQAQRSEKE